MSERPELGLVEAKTRMLGTLVRVVEALGDCVVTLLFIGTIYFRHWWESHNGGVHLGPIDAVVDLTIQVGVALVSISYVGQLLWKRFGLLQLCEFVRRAYRGRDDDNEPPDSGIGAEPEPPRPGTGGAAKDFGNQRRRKSWSGGSVLSLPPRGDFPVRVGSSLILGLIAAPFGTWRGFLGMPLENWRTPLPEVCLAITMGCWLSAVALMVIVGIRLRWMHRVRTTWSAGASSAVSESLRTGGSIVGYSDRKVYVRGNHGRGIRLPLEVFDVNREPSIVAQISDLAKRAPDEQLLRLSLGLLLEEIARYVALENGPHREDLVQASASLVSAESTSQLRGVLEDVIRISHASGVSAAAISDAALVVYHALGDAGGR